MRAKLFHWLNKDKALIFNAGSLIGTTLLTSGLGFVYWWLAAQLFPAEAVGLASAAVSVMMLLGSIGIMGFGTLLIRELPRQQARAGSLISTALVLAGIAAGVLGIGFALVAPSLSTEFTPLGGGVDRIAAFALGVTATAVTLVLDQAMIGLLRGGLQFWRNGLFAAVKLGLLLFVGRWFADELGMGIYTTWTIGNIVSTIMLAAYLALRGSRILYQPKWRLLQGFGWAAMSHHALNLVLQTPGLVLPLLTTMLLTAATNASFYAAWMIAGFAFVIPTALTTVLFAAAVADPLEFSRQIRRTLGLSLGVGIPTSIGLFVSAGLILQFFGQAYAQQAEWSLRIFGIAVFPLIIKQHYIAICRVQAKITQATKVMALGGLLELALAALGGLAGGLTGLSLGWVAAVYLESIVAVPLIYEACSFGMKLPTPDTSGTSEAERTNLTLQKHIVSRS